MTPQSDKQSELGQYFTPVWFAEATVESFYGDLSAARIVEPSCGPGHFLQVFPNDADAIGVEIDPEYAAIARERTGRDVICGPFESVELPYEDGTVDFLIGNPPYNLSVVDRFLERARTLLTRSGEIGLILPAYTFQTPSRVLRYAEDWRLDTQMIPRTIFPGIKLPLVFAQFRKQGPQWVGLALYQAVHDVAGMKKPVQETLKRGRGSIWRTVVAEALEAIGPEASLPEIYAHISPRRPTENRWWREKVRQTLQRYFRREGRGYVLQAA